MKAVGKRIVGWLDFYRHKGTWIEEKPYEWYMAVAESKAYDEISEAFGIWGGTIKFGDFEGLKAFVEKIAAQLNCPRGSIMQSTEFVNGEEKKYVSLRMPNRLWKFYLTSAYVRMTTLPLSVFDATQECWISPRTNLAAILPDLDRMMPVLERMTKNLIDEAYHDFLQRQCQVDSAGKKDTVKVSSERIQATESESSSRTEGQKEVKVNMVFEKGIGRQGYDPSSDLQEFEENGLHGLKTPLDVLESIRKELGDTLTKDSRATLENIIEEFKGLGALTEEDLEQKEGIQSLLEKTYSYVNLSEIETNK